LVVVHPIYKAGVNEYRTISLLSHLGKVSERSVIWLLESEIQLNDNQFRYHPEVSPIDAAHLAHHYSSLSSSQGKKTAVLLLDMSKALRLTTASTLVSSSENCEIIT